MVGLFRETAYFDTGRKHGQDFDLPDADRYYHGLLTISPWKHRRQMMYDKVMPDPGLSTYYGGERGHQWTPVLLELKGKVGGNAVYSLTV